MTNLSDLGARALSYPSTVRASYQMAKAAIEAHIPGDFVECGVFAGTQAAAMARAVMESMEDRKVHLFDSFEGIPLAGEHDKEFMAAGHQAGLSTCTREAVERHMQEWGIDPRILVYHPGWFSETVPRFNENIAVLRLDGDLYESTKVCMDHLYPKLSVGGWCIVDDWHLSGARKAVEEAIGAPSPIYFQK